MKSYLPLFISLLLTISIFAQDQNDNPKAKEKELKKQQKIIADGDVKIIIQQGVDIAEDLNIDLNAVLKNHKGKNGEPLIIINGKKVDNLNDVNKLIPGNIDIMIKDAMKQQLGNPNKQILDRYDKDGDGKLNDEERKAAKKEMDDQIAEGMKQATKIFEQLNKEGGIEGLQNLDIPQIREGGFRFNRRKNNDHIERNAFPGPETTDDDEHFEGVL